jgi:cytochrome c-type biogenesis protein CcmH/NrfG
MVVRRHRVLAVVLALGVPAIALVPLAASGEPKPKQEKDGRYDADNITAISQFMETIAKGTTLFAAKDVTGAIDTYRKAVQLSPKNALGYYFLAEAYLASGNLGEAEAAIAQAHELNDPRNPALRARVLFLTADVYERAKKKEQARAAWQAYTEHAAKFGPDSGAYPHSGAERLKVMQKILEMEKAYSGVRERIAAEKDGGKSPPKK